MKATLLIAQHIDDFYDESRGVWIHVEFEENDELLNPTPEQAAVISQYETVFEKGQEELATCRLYKMAFMDGWSASDSVSLVTFDSPTPNRDERKLPLTFPDN